MIKTKDVGSNDRQTKEREGHLALKKFRREHQPVGGGEGTRRKKNGLGVMLLSDTYKWRKRSTVTEGPIRYGERKGKSRQQTGRAVTSLRT